MPEHRTPRNGDRVKIDGRVGVLTELHRARTGAFLGRLNGVWTPVPPDLRWCVEYGDPQVARDNEILRTVVGSGVHGIAIAGTDDHDEMGVYIEPRDVVIGLKGWDYNSSRWVHASDSSSTGMPNYVWRSQPEGDRSEPGDTDLVIHSLRRYLLLAIQGNPTALLPLFAPAADVLVQTDLGGELRARRSWFLSVQAADRFLGYMHNQKERMLGRGRRSLVPNRPELIERYGWDVKYGSHALRLAYQCRELVDEGNLSLPLRQAERDRVLAVKTGHVGRDEVSAEISDIELSLQATLKAGASALPPTANFAALSAWSQQAHLTQWAQL